jgi:GLPGLI family protein
MKVLFTKLFIPVLILLVSFSIQSQDFQGKAYYFSKTPMDLGNWGAKMSQEQKKQIGERLKNRLEKTYILTFNKEESIFKEEEKLDALSGATDSWGKNFTPGEQYKNIKTLAFLQSQEFYGKKFLIKENLQSLDWKMEGDSKKIGNYTCFKATVMRPVFDTSWWTFSWGEISQNTEKEDEDKNSEDQPVENMIQIEAWYTPMIPVSQGPGDYYGLPGLILEVSVGSTTLLCSKVVMNPKEKINITGPNKGKEVTKKEYKEIISGKMVEMRNNRGGRSGRR